MKVVILAGGLGSRIMEESGVKPKPMIEIGNRPILWHIMKIYSHYGFNDFVICLGYKGYVIKEYFMNYYALNSDMEVDISKNSVKYLNNNNEKFKVTLVDTGLHTNTAGRINRIKDYVGDEFMLTYGDGVGNIDLKSLIKFHRSTNKLVTLTSVLSKTRFGELKFNSNNEVTSFHEKTDINNNWINAGFFVIKKEIFKYLNDPEIDNIQWENDPLKKIAKDGELSAYKHEGFWKPMDAMRDKIELEKLWSSNPEWKIW